MANVYAVRDLLSGAEVGLTEDRRFDLFYYLEGDPLVRTANHGRIAKELWGHAQSEPDVLVAECSGRTRLVWLHPTEDSLWEDAPHVAIQYISYGLLAKSQMRIANWVRLSGFIHRVRNHLNASVRGQVLRLVGGEGTTVAQVRNHLGSIHPCLVYGAIAMGLRARELTADLDRVHLNGALMLKPAHD